MVAGARRGLDRVRAAGRGGQPSRRSFVGHLSPARQRQVARRQAGHGRGRDLLARRLQEASSATIRPTTATSRRRRRPASARSPSPSTARATANCRRSSASSTCCRSIGGRAPTSPASKRDIGATTLEPPLGCGAYRHQGFRARPHHRLRARARTIGARTSTSISAAITSTSCATSISATPPSRSKPSRPTQIDWRTENSAKNWATAYDFPAVKDKRVVLEEFPINSSGGMQAFAFNTRRDEVQGSARAPRLQLRARFRGDEQADVLRPVQARRQLFRRHWSLRRADCRRARSSRSSKPCATRCRRRSSPRPTPIRSSGSAEAVRTNLREATRLLREAGYEIRNQQAGQRQDRRAVHGRSPDRPARIGSASCCPTSRRWSGSASR